jgi:peptidyl-prolyl cis-trans isomerase B (cyclophilin B)
VAGGGPWEERLVPAFTIGRMPKRLLAVLLLLAAGALAACGGDDSGDQTATDSVGAGTSPSAGSQGTPQGDADPAAVTCDYPADNQIPAAKDVNPPPAAPTVGGNVPATLTTSVGDLQITLDAAKAPCTVNSFVSLATQGYFDGSPCHRLTTLDESGIAVLQCGDPGGTGAGGPGYTYADETNGDETYGPGVLAMANRGPDTNGSQFFIVYDDSPLPPDYTVFGTVDQASLKPIEDLAAEGTVPGPGGITAPKEKVTIESISWG